MINVADEKGLYETILKIYSPALEEVLSLAPTAAAPVGGVKKLRMSRCFLFPSGVLAAEDLPEKSDDNYDRKCTEIPRKDTPFLHIEIEFQLFSDNVMSNNWKTFTFNF